MHTYSVLYYPPFDSAKDYADQYYRMAWYISALSDFVDTVYVPATVELPARPERAEYFDPALDDMVDEVQSKVRFFDGNDYGEWLNILDEVEFVFAWKVETGAPDRLPEHPAKAVIQTKQVLRVDKDLDRFEVSQWAWFTWRGNRLLGKDTQECREKFDALCREGTLAHEKGYIFGTGPSLVDQMSDYDFSDGVTIACNSMVMNLDLLDRMQPKAICISDPLFHAGCSSYAGEFRDGLAKAMRRYEDCRLIVPMRDYRIYKANFASDLTDRIIGVPFRHHREPNLDWTADLEVTATENVLTHMLLPLAATFFKEIDIAGCDGRPLDENDYFWKHDPKVQIPEQMDASKEAHPAFFVMDYNDYYERHCNVTERWISACEDKGITVRNLTPSFIPALAKRFDVNHAARPEGTSESAGPLVSLIMNANGSNEDLQRTIETLTDQTWQNWELLVVGTREVDQNVAAGDRRVTFVTPRENGAAAAWTAGNERAWGRFVGYLDSDTFFFDRNALTRMVEPLFANKALAAYCPADVVDETLRSTGLKPGIGVKEIAFSDLFRMRVPLGSFLFRRDGVAQTPFEEKGSLSGWLWLQRAMRSGIVAQEVSGASVGWRLKPEQRTFDQLVEVERDENSLMELAFTADPGCPNPHPLHAEGLEPTNRLNQQLRRRLTLITLLAMREQTAEACSLAKEFTGTQYDDLPHYEIIEALRNGTMLALSCNEGLWRGFFAGRFERFASVLAAVPEFANSVVLKHALRLLGRPGYAENMSETALVHDLLNDGTPGTMIDVGAHYGGSLLPFACSGWNIHAFEPDEHNRIKLNRLVSAFPNVTVQSVAVSNEESSGQAFFKSDVSAGISSLLDFHESHQEAQRVDVTTLARYCEQYDLGSIDFLKIDVEGLDLFVLKGVDWGKCRPRVIVAEYEDGKTRNLGYDVNDTVSYLMDLGYKLMLSEWYPVERYGGNHRWRDMHVAPCKLLDQTRGWGNIIALRDESDFIRFRTIADVWALSFRKINDAKKR